MDNKIVIIGSGAAAIAAIKAINEVNPQSKIVVFGEEKFYPYYRIKISKGLLGGLEEEKILIQKKEWYSFNNVELNLDKKVIKVIPEKKEVILQDGSSVSYSKLLLANGASNLTPSIKGIDKPGVFTLRSLEGAFKIIDYLKDSNEILLIGGGIQNLELANVLSKSGKKVIIAEFNSRLMARQLDPYSSNLLKNSIEAQGVEIMLNTQVSEILGSKNVEGFVTKLGIKKTCNMVIYSTGIKPNIEIVHNTELNVNKGIKVNEEMETNIKDIFAAGDVAEFSDKVYGLWGIATEQGKIAGANICKKGLNFEPKVPVTSLDAFDMSIFSIGDIEEYEDTDLLIEFNDKDNKYYKIFIGNKQIVGAIIIGDSKKFMTIKGFIDNKIEFDFVKTKGYSIDEFIEMVKITKQR